MYDRSIPMSTARVIEQNGQKYTEWPEVHGVRTVYDRWHTVGTRGENGANRAERPEVAGMAELAGMYNCVRPVASLWCMASYRGQEQAFRPVLTRMTNSVRYRPV